MYEWGSLEGYELSMAVSNKVISESSKSRSYVITNPMAKVPKTLGTSSTLEIQGFTNTPDSHILQVPHVHLKNP